MIPRLKPFLDRREFLAACSPKRDAVELFEREFALLFGARHAIAFPYGRTALWAIFKALAIEEKEVVIPAYTCSVVAHAVVLSGNIPRFVDITLYDYNMDLSKVEGVINDRTAAVVATHLFGYPLDIDYLRTIVRTAEKKYKRKILIIHDCAHCFGAAWKGRLVCNQDDVGLFGLNISKMITSIFGGMLTLNDAALNNTLRSWREANLVSARRLKGWRRRIYLAAVYGAFNETIYSLVHGMEKKTALLDSFTKAYHMDEQIHFPPDFRDPMSSVEAMVGLAQLKKYAKIVAARRANACYYNEHLRDRRGLVLPPIVEGATYSHYPVRVDSRDVLVNKLAEHGIEIGQLIEYSLPHTPAYLQYSRKEDYPNSRLCSQHMINLPVYATMKDHQRGRVVEILSAACSKIADEQRR